ncbi:Hypothetical protein FKW44_001636 [Caligus rogercresseyi]|uniref:Uncharacterized protein n=1 Tax=Caligus rogercresseyi TaxID=217165 RepID=A0A7T8KJ02_CALRO|nr:Hypothetical protein FKW44_001636 [Caligus rogercresseyi]
MGTLLTYFWGTLSSTAKELSPDDPSPFHPRRRHYPNGPFPFTSPDDPSPFHPRLRHHPNGLLRLRRRMNPHPSHH